MAEPKRRLNGGPQRRANREQKREQNADIGGRVAPELARQHAELGEDFDELADETAALIKELDDEIGRRWMTLRLRLRLERIEEILRSKS